MAINYQKLPVYEQKQRILDSLNDNQVIVVQSPTGSGKTTQIPVILHEAGYSANGVIAFSPRMQDTFDFFHSYMYSDIYVNPVAKSEESKVDGIIEKLFHYYASDPGRLPEDYAAIALLEGPERAACDYISGMTDGYAMEKYSELFIPFAWTVK
jgi:dGTPase